VHLPGESLLQDLCRVIGGTVINDDNFGWFDPLSESRSNCFFNKRSRIVSSTDHRKICPRDFHRDLDNLRASAWLFNKARTWTRDGFFMAFNLFEFMNPSE